MGGEILILGPLDFLSNNLTRLNLSHNRLQSLGGGLKKLKSLTDLDISFNYLDSMVLRSCVCVCVCVCVCGMPVLRVNVLFAMPAGNVTVDVSWHAAIRTCYCCCLQRGIEFAHALRRLNCACNWSHNNI